MNHTCPSCSRPLTKHLGLVGTCAKLRRARAALTAILNPTRSLTYKQRVTLYRALAKAGLECSK